MNQQTGQVYRMKGGVSMYKGQETSTSQMASCLGSGEDWSLQTGLSAGHTPVGQDTGDDQTQEELGSGSGRGEEAGATGASEGQDITLSLPELTSGMLMLHNRKMEKQLVNNFMEAKKFGESAKVFQKCLLYFIFSSC